MKKTIFPQKGRWPIYKKQIEALPDFCRALKERYPKIFKIFDDFINHTDIQFNEVLSVYPNSVFIYCNGLIYIPSDEQKIKKIEIEYNSELPDVFFDKTNGRKRGYDQLIYQLYLNKRYLGTYYPEPNVLFLTDITHEPKYINDAVEIFVRLYHLLPIRRVKSNRKKQKKRITVGADPEFELYNGEKIQNAYNAISTRNNEYGEVGRDGADYQVELRPHYGNHITVVRNFKNLLKLFKKSYPDYDLLTKGDVYPLGGHIHFNIPPTEDFVGMLDDFLGEKLLKLSGKARGDYCKLHAYRSQPWGFEYRTLPSIIFNDPKIAKIVLKIARNLAEIYVNRVKEITYEVPVTFVYYKKYCKLTEEEFDYFNQYIEGNIKDFNIIANWKIRKNLKSRIIVNFRDEWNSNVKKYFTEHLDKLRPRKSINLTLFGLRKDRGNVVYGIKLHHFKTLPPNTFNFQSKNENTLIIGIPWKMRMEITENTDKLINKIKKEIRKISKEG